MKVELPRNFIPEKLTNFFNPEISKFWHWMQYREIFFEFSILFFLIAFTVHGPYPWGFTWYWLISFCIISILSLLKGLYLRNTLLSSTLFAMITVTTVARSLFLYTDHVYPGAILWLMFFRLFSVNWSGLTYPGLKTKDIVEAIEIMDPNKQG